MRHFPPKEEREKSETLAELQGFVACRENVRQDALNEGVAFWFPDV